ncbi:MAG TPA: HAMP domain-containing sensor histidine kinase [Vicinamibacteria bacterium]|nr:HAMP domain-containing sensor histidine kinase [Vicinamibacteria bacterium]
MKVSLKSALGLAVVHLALLIALAVGLERTLRSLENQLSADTVRLLAREQANLVHERSVATLLYPDADSRRRLHERIEDLTVLSEVVTSLAVVDAAGHLVASQDEESHGQFAPASEVFGWPPQSRLEQSGRRSFLRGGDYVVLVPLLDEGRMAGYLRVGLHSDRIASLYEEGRWRLVLLGLLGLAGVGAVGVFLQVELSRRAATIAAALEGKAPPQGSIAPADEFARVLRSASRVKSDLEEARRESERRGVQVGALAQILQVGVVVAGRELHVDYVSARARELLGSADETAFRAAWEGLRPRLHRVLSESSMSPRGSPVLTLEVEPGRSVLAELHKLEGPTEDYLVLLRDPRALEALEADARLLSQLDGLGRVYRTLAHELRAPLGAMMINLDLLHETLGKGDGDATTPVLRHVDVLRQELNRINRSLLEILTQTVPENPPERFDLNGSLTDLVALLVPQARSQSVEVAVSLPEPSLPVRGYPHRLRQALLNVAVNALEAMPNGGRLRVEACREGGRARVALRDTGPGIAADALPRLCDPEFSTKDGGSGIGLHVARAIVELHGGEFRIESDLGRGTDVLVLMPLAEGGA